MPEPHVGEQVQLRIMYAAIYLDLGIIPLDKLPALEKRLELESKKFVNIFPCKLKMLFPTLSKVVFALKKTTVGIDRSTALARFRWLCRDSPDNFLLRYIRVCGSTLDATIALGQAIVFQIRGFDAQQELERGELYYLEKQPKFIEQLKSAKATFGEKDHQGRPVIVCRAKNFGLAGESRTTDCRMMCSLLELAYICQSDKEDGIVFVLDLSGWDTIGLDYPLVRLLMELLASGPPVLHRLFVYKPPSSFSLFWNFYKRFVSPWLALKTTVVHRAKDMGYVVPLTSLPKYIGGKSSLVNLWTPPKASDELVDLQVKAALLKERKILGQQLEKATASWVFDPSLDRSDTLAAFTTNYWKLDPHVRSRTVWDRTGVVGIYRDELKFGGVAQPLCESYMLSDAEAEAATTASVLAQTIDNCSLNTLVDSNTDVSQLVKELDTASLDVTTPVVVAP